MATTPAVPVPVNAQATQPAAPTPDLEIKGKPGATHMMRKAGHQLEAKNAAAAEAAKAVATAKPAQAAANGEKRFTLKVNGTEKQVTESELLRLASLAEGSQAKFQEAAQLRAKSEQILNLLQKNPAQVMKLLGVSPREWAEKHLLEEITKEGWTPQQRQAHENAQKLARLEALEKQRQQQAQQAQLQARQAAIIRELDATFTSALQEAGLAKNPANIAKMASLARTLNKKGVPVNQSTAKHLAQHLRSSIQAELNDLIKGQPDDYLDGLFSDDSELWKRVSKAKLKKLKASGVRFSKAGPSSSTMTGPSNQQSRQESWSAFKRRNRYGA